MRMGIAAADPSIVPTIGSKVLYCLVVLAHSRRKLVHHAGTAHPTAEWIARHSRGVPVGYSTTILNQMVTQSNGVPET